MNDSFVKREFCRKRKNILSEVYVFLTNRQNFTQNQKDGYKSGVSLLWYFIIIIQTGKANKNVMELKIISG